MGRAKANTQPYIIPGYRISLVREGETGYEKLPQVRYPADTAHTLQGHFRDDLDREVFVVLLLSVRHRVIGLHTVSVGCMTSAVVHPREVFKAAILGGAAAIVLAHNHPSGDPEPSSEDVALTRRLSAVGTLLGVEVLDHLVLGTASEKWVSLKERGVL